MIRLVALHREVSPMNIGMKEHKQCLESAGCCNVKTILSSGNVAFDSGENDVSTPARFIEDRLQAFIRRRYPAEAC